MAKPCLDERSRPWSWTLKRCCGTRMGPSNRDEPEDHQRLCSIHWTRIISISNDSRKSHGYYLQIAWLRGTSSWRSISLYPSKNGRCSQIIENSKTECPDIWIRLPRHRWPKSWSSIEDTVVLLERNLYGHPLAGLLRERQFEKLLL